MDKRPCAIAGVLAAVLLWSPIASAGAASPEPKVTLGARSFTIETPRLVATFQDGMLVSVKNLKTGELHADASLADHAIPAGINHLTGDPKAMERLHHVWGATPLNLKSSPAGRYPTMHRPHAESKYQAERTANGVRATWTGLTNGRQRFSQETLTIEAWMDADSGQLLFYASCTSDQGGVVGLQVPLANLHPDQRFYVASFGGVMYDRHADPALISLGGAPFWEAPVVGIEGRQGSLGLWVEDPKFSNRFFFLNWSGASFSLAIEYLNLMPFEGLKRARSFTWRLDAFSGGWVDAMTPYRDWYARQFAPEMQIRAATKWADKIRVIVDHFEHSDEMYRRIASAFGPETVLFHDWNARAPRFDTELPDWTPRAGYAETVKALHRHGFHTMAYVNTYCVNYNSPVFKRDRIQEFGLTRKIGSIARYTASPQSFQTTKDGDLLYLDPLSPRWRKYHTDMMIRWRHETGTDANYEDVAGTVGDFGNGVVEGCSAGQGGVEQFRELLRRNPTVPMASEYAPSEVAFAVRWPLRYQQVWGGEKTRIWWMERMRPVSAWIHGPLHYAWIPVIRAENDFSRHVVVACSDALGGVAQIAGTAAEWNATAGLPAHMRSRAGLFARRQLTPCFSADRGEPDLACAYRDREGRLYKYFANKTMQQMIGPDGEPIYQRVRGLSRVTTPLTLPGWPAAADRAVFGLNPDVCYCLERQAEGRTKLQVVELPENVGITRYESTPQRTVLALAPAGANGPRQGKVKIVARARFLQASLNDRPIGLPQWSEKGQKSSAIVYETPLPAWFAFFERAAPAVRPGEPLGDGQEKARYLSASLGLERGGEYVIPHRAGFPVPGRKPGPMFLFLNGGGDSELVLDYLTTAPQDGVLEVLMKNNQNRYGNGAIGRVYINGRPVHQFDFGPRPNPAWKKGQPAAEKTMWDTDVHAWSIPLGPMAGQPVAVTIASDPKGENNADSLWWARPLWRIDPAQKPRFVRITQQGEVSE